MDQRESIVQEFKSAPKVDDPTQTIQKYRGELRAVGDAMDCLSGRWKMPIICLLCAGEFRFSELKTGIPKITPRMLSKQLKELEAYELIERTVHPTSPVKVYYKLSDYGYSLAPIIVELAHWGKTHRRTIIQSGAQTVKAI
jgi:DNA-binding HxlR family transcriptional regulator